MTRKKKNNVVNGNAEKPAKVAPVAKAKVPREKRKTPAFRQVAAPSSEEIGKNEISDDAIRIRAYFISEARSQFAIPGDAAADWIEARRQLMDEARREQSAVLGANR